MPPPGQSRLTPPWRRFGSPGFGIPGAANLHSHAFQRALAGRAERGVEDTFWTWRARMYEFVERLEPRHLRAIATMAYMEMLEHGFTAVGEFHYLHHDPAGRDYANSAEMSEQCIAAAADAGIALTLLPIFYAHGGFGAPPEAAQRRFVHADPERSSSPWSRACGRRRPRTAIYGWASRCIACERSPQRNSRSSRRAPGSSIRRCRSTSTSPSSRPRSRPAPSRLAPGRSKWLLANAEVDARWTLVHGIQSDAAERGAMAASGAVVCLCPATEAALGDGVFAFEDYIRQGGRWGIGTDAHYTASVAEELRILEFGQRLTQGRRGPPQPTDAGTTAHAGRRLYDLALGAAASSLTQPMGGFEPGARADLVVLDANGPVLLGHGPSTGFDAWVLSGTTNPVTGVMVGGRWRVEDGRHLGREGIMAGYARALGELFGGA